MNVFIYLILIGPSIATVKFYRIKLYFFTYWPDKTKHELLLIFEIVEVYGDLHNNWGQLAVVQLAKMHGLHLYVFSKDPELRKKCVDQVKPTLELNKWEPANHSFFYSKHFGDDCFQPYCKLQQQNPWEWEGSEYCKNRCNTILYVPVELIIS